MHYFLKFITFLTPLPPFILSIVQNGSMHQKDGVNDDDFEPYISSQTNQVTN